MGAQSHPGPLIRPHKWIRLHKNPPTPQNIWPECVISGFTPPGAELSVVEGSYQLILSPSQARRVGVKLLTSFRPSPASSFTVVQSASLTWSLLSMCSSQQGWDPDQEAAAFSLRWAALFSIHGSGGWVQRRWRSVRVDVRHRTSAFLWFVCLGSVGTIRLRNSCSSKTEINL